MIAEAQDRLKGDEDGGTVEIAGYLETLCAGLGDLLRDIRPVAVRVNADRAAPLRLVLPLVAQLEGLGVQNVVLVVAEAQ